MARASVITFLRIDSRLIHGQVVEAWLPGLKVARVVVADDEAAHSPLMKTAMGLAVPPELEVDILPLGETPFPTITERPYQLSLGPYMFLWFRLERPGPERA